MNKLKSALCVFLLALGLPITAKEYTYQAVEGDLMNTRIYTYPHLYPRQRIKGVPVGQ